MAREYDNTQRYDQAFNAYIVNNYEQAAENIDLYLRDFPNDLNAHLLKGHIYSHGFHRYQEAKMEYEFVMGSTTDADLLTYAQEGIAQIPEESSDPYGLGQNEPYQQFADSSFILPRQEEVNFIGEEGFTFATENALPLDLYHGHLTHTNPKQELTLTDSVLTTFPKEVPLPEWTLGGEPENSVTEGREIEYRREHPTSLPQTIRDLETMDASAQSKLKALITQVYNSSREVMVAMDTVEEQMAETRQRVKQVTESFQEISKLIITITDSTYKISSLVVHIGEKASQMEAMNPHLTGITAEIQQLANQATLTIHELEQYLSIFQTPIHQSD
ncbi:MAG: methyl-accepting chemotaxis protein [Cyanobacteria bacterium LVE1205-1]